MEVWEKNNTGSSDATNSSPKLTSSLKLKSKIKKIYIGQRPSATIINELNDSGDCQDIQEILDLISNKRSEIKENCRNSPNLVLSPASAKREFIIRKSLLQVSPRVTKQSKLNNV